MAYSRYQLLLWTNQHWIRPLSLFFMSLDACMCYVSFECQDSFYPIYWQVTSCFGLVARSAV